ncbi:hypothetical protein [Paenibacillus harenae]|uniref:hypothetical protein n=1 Tax=Paenibacillus harenae TaxID=306543 RepID=UPI00278EC869|nr:hypothetical protein [Paenibacillus harenae]MDQ0064036.1 hypothetical protein [Paenibacillus harenae]
MDTMQFDYISIHAYKLPHKLAQKSYGNIEKAFNKARKKSQSTGIHADACDFSGRLHSFVFIVGLGTFASNSSRTSSRLFKAAAEAARSRDRLIYYSDFLKPSASFFLSSLTSSLTCN